MRGALFIAIAFVAAAFFFPFVATGDGIGAQYRVRRERGELAAASVTGTSLGTANTLLTTTKATVTLIADTDCSVPFMVTKDGEDFKRLFAGKGVGIDLNANGVALAAGTYKIYYTGSAPSSCTVELFAVPYR